MWPIITEVKTPRIWKKWNILETAEEKNEELKMQLLQDQVIEFLYQNRLDQKLE